jgi:hypothetical protein
VPVGYFSEGIVARNDYIRRQTAEKEFWKAWGLGEIRDEFLRDAGVRYIAVHKQSEGIPEEIPPALLKVFENSEYAVFKVRAIGFDQPIKRIEDPGR